MVSRHFKGCNQTFGPPKGWSDEECFTVHAMITDGPKGGIVVRTAWHPSVSELEDIAAGRPIFLETFGGMPPVMLFTLHEDGKPSFLDPDSIGSDVKKSSNLVQLKPKI